MAKYKIVGPNSETEFDFDWSKIFMYIIFIVVIVIFFKYLFGKKEGFAVNADDNENCDYYELDNNDVNTSFVNTFQSYFN